MTKLIYTFNELNQELNFSEKPIALIPTMGALHDGHKSLIEEALKENKTVIVYIFVNPLQFGPQEDFNIYPRDLNKDFKLCQNLNVHYVFAPEVNEVFPDLNNFQNNLIQPPEELENILCGKTRINHFKGVATVIKRFLDLINPDSIYFGKKDLQQIYIIKWLLKEYGYSTSLTACPTVREPSGLALSSRNSFLSPEEKIIASKIYESLKLAKDYVKSGMCATKKAILEALIFLSQYKEIKVEYFEARDTNSLKETDDKKNSDFYFFIAARIGKVRLIDNIEL